MSANWVNSLDALAASGVLDYDAASYLTDAPARYVGHPDFEKISDSAAPVYLTDGIKLPAPPDKDVLVKSNDQNLIENPKWKKVLFGIVAAIGSVFGALALFKFIKK